MMEFIREQNGLRIKIDEDAKALMLDLKEDRGEIQSDEAMLDFFHPYLCNSEFEFIAPEDVGALTSAPMLGIKARENEDDEDSPEYIAEAYAYMDYQVKSILEDLLENGEVFLQGGKTEKL